jgi:ElaB/YqjD/DUF883 family membrane-anchored ribosome-binding protein
MDQEPDVIRHQIDQTRSSLTDKLETLENQVRDTVCSAKNSVEATIENVKSTVHDTVCSVKQTLNLNYQVEHHPWAMFGGSVVAGFVLGSLWTRRSTLSGARSGPVYNGHNGPVASGSTLSRLEAERPMSGGLSGMPAQTEPKPEPGWLDRFVNLFGDEIERVKEIAIGAAMGTLQDVVEDALPQYAPQIENVMESATIKLGGKPMARPTRRAEHSYASR